VPPRAFSEEVLQQPTNERLAYFRSYTLAHPQLKTVSEALRRAIQEPGGASLIFVVGPTGVGKTTLRLRIEQELKQRFLAAGEPEPGRIPVVGFEAAAPDSGNFSLERLLSPGLACAGRTAHRLQARSSDACPERDCRVVCGSQGMQPRITPSVGTSSASSTTGGGTDR